MSKRHTFKFGYLDFMDTYAVITCNEGAYIDFEEIEEIEAVLDKAYYGKRFGLIANRENFYSVNPGAIDKLFSRENLVAGAIVGRAIKHAINAAWENTVVTSATIKYFFDMSQAVTWMEDSVGKDSTIH